MTEEFTRLQGLGALASLFGSFGDIMTSQLANSALFYLFGARSDIIIRAASSVLLELAHPVEVLPSLGIFRFLKSSFIGPQTRSKRTQLVF
jgi:hypothetical protein